MKVVRTTRCPRANSEGMIRPQLCLKALQGFIIKIILSVTLVVIMVASAQLVADTVISVDADLSVTLTNATSAA
jgi:hypothetical protein